MTKVQLGAFQRERGIRVGLSFFVFLEEYDAFSLIDVSRKLMMLRHNGEIHQIMVGKILHIMSVVHRAVMHLYLRFLAPNFSRFDSFLAPNFRRFNPFLAPNFRKIRIFAPDYQRVTNYEKISKKTYRQRT